MSGIDKVLVVAPLFHQTAWEIRLLFESLRRVGFPLEDVVWLSHGGSDAAYEYALKLVADTGVEFHWYEDDRPKSEYLTSIRPWLIAKYLREDEAREEHTYLYIDSDVVVNTIPDVDELGADEGTWVGSSVSSYAAMGKTDKATRQHLKQVLGKEAFKKYRYIMPGAQWVLVQPSPEVFATMYELCEEVFTAIRDDDECENDAWFSDMWALPAAALHYGVSCVAHEDLDFALVDDPYEDFYSKPFYHNSGATVQSSLLRAVFVKREWKAKSPLGRVHVLSPLYAGYGYVEFMKHLDPDTAIIDIVMPNVWYGSMRGKNKSR